MTHPGLRLAVASFLLLALAALAPARSFTDASATTGELEVHFLDVGQGDGAILRTPNGKIILVDSGRKSRGPEILDYLEEMGVQEIYAIAPYIDTPLVGLPSPTPFVDKDCPDFSTWQEAQAFFLANGGPSKDPHRLDNDGNGLACETLPGGPNS